MGKVAKHVYAVRVLYILLPPAFLNFLSSATWLSFGAHQFYDASLCLAAAGFTPASDVVGALTRIASVPPIWLRSKYKPGVF